MAKQRPDWRSVREDMEHEKYLELRRHNRDSGSNYTENQLREMARKHANEVCRLAIRRGNQSRNA